jgi:cob(I)alamin adenosyltransferase
MRIYTRTGDQGQTGLFGGERLRKDDPRVEAYGAVDELNAAIGLALSTDCFGDLRMVLQRLQGELFTVGADLATPSTSAAGAPPVPRVTAEMVAALEQDIDRFEASLEPLRHFILPGGTVAAATLHMARATCRRAERRLVSLTASDEVTSSVVPYLNRLSDLLFVLARAANQHAGQAETEWRPPSAPQGE